jgi:hypothetical protein
VTWAERGPVSSLGGALVGGGEGRASAGASEERALPPLKARPVPLSPPSSSFGFNPFCSTTGAAPPSSTNGANGACCPRARTIKRGALLSFLGAFNAPRAPRNPTSGARAIATGRRYWPRSAPGRRSWLAAASIGALTRIGQGGGRAFGGGRGQCPRPLPLSLLARAPISLWPHVRACVITGRLADLMIALAIGGRVHCSGEKEGARRGWRALLCASPPLLPPPSFDRRARFSPGRAPQWAHARGRARS